MRFPWVLEQTYSLKLNLKDVESCPQKYAIFKTIRTWENARAVNVFPRWVKLVLMDAEKSFRLEQVDADDWNLYTMNSNGADKKLLTKLTRAKGY